MANKKKRTYTCKVCGQKMTGPTAHAKKHREELVGGEGDYAIEELVGDALKAVQGEFKARQQRQRKAVKLLKQAVKLLEE